ncbi:pyruvate, phosphate dikinase [Paenibacillus sp.]|jgi:pyruvate,orthophosphate dikinase|uniref:pyruvate, phosphate dikinase n=1 Tax=Paenibacillus sp. TaxID=58172 RepID=UPI00281FCF93|nr:pyruvate, phosphate dikinase [Paenibacillus sp.]MDR0271553.1 pyruvate, phosphate dikinase [Paenibacillus sp.]
MTILRVNSFQNGGKEDVELLGGKGANLAEMTKVGLPVPLGFTITTEVCREFYRTGRRLPEGLMEEVLAALNELEQEQNRGFGHAERPLLVSVRSGAVKSMPGMMDTILNLGLNDETVEGLAKQTNNRRFAYDCYRRFIQMYGSVVYNIEGIHFERLIQKEKQLTGCMEDQQLSEESLLSLAEQFKKLIEARIERSFPQDVKQQLQGAIEAVFLSWSSARAKVYRKVHLIPDDQGTAVNVQSMVFGNMGETSGTGVLFTRNPSTGESVMFGEFLMNAQGEDVVGGTRTPSPIADLQETMPEAYKELSQCARQLELQYRDMQDIEFTIENGKLYLLQTRNAKRNARAALKVAADLVQEGLISKEEALMRIDVQHLNHLLHRSLNTEAEHTVMATGLPASPGAACGQVVFEADTADEWKRGGKQVILVRMETTPEDIHGVIAAEGVVTLRGGMTSHAAVVARGMGKPCVCGCEALQLDEEQMQLSGGGVIIREGDWITIDGGSAKVIPGQLELSEADLSPELMLVLDWADEVRTMKVLANADSPVDARKAREFGAEGIGLCRTEHMFLSPARVPIVQQMILAETEGNRQVALNRLLPMQRSDFEDIFREMDGYPVTIRLLDPPLHEFLPNIEELTERLTELRSTEEETSNERMELERMIRRVRELQESNPMLGQRGCRLGIMFPEIYEMQVEAIFQAVLRCLRDGINVLPQVMIPLVGHVNELHLLRNMVDEIAEQVLGEEKRFCGYKVGTMIEVPRAALTAGDIARSADFFSFGTNDLTQMTFGYSRDDAEGKFLAHYVEHKLLPHNPFQVLDTEGVGKLIEMAVTQGRAVNPLLKTSICGEHGGDHESIMFCQRTGLDYISCSPYRLPVSRIAAAQAHIRMQSELASKVEETSKLEIEQTAI